MDFRERDSQEVAGLWRESPQQVLRQSARENVVTRTPIFRKHSEGYLKMVVRGRKMQATRASSIP